MGKFFTKLAEEMVVVKEPNLIEKTVSIPNRWAGKLVLWDKEVSVRSSKDFDKKTLEVIHDLSSKHDNVKVYVGHSPMFAELRRGLEGKGIIFKHPVARTLFAPFNAMEILSSKISGGDHYNPATNSVVLRSNIPAIAAHEFGHSADYASKKHPFLYNIGTSIPPFYLIREYAASRRAGKYLKENDLDSSILTPAFGTYLGGAFLGNPILGAVGGHIVKDEVKF